MDLLSTRVKANPASFLQTTKSAPRICIFLERMICAFKINVLIFAYIPTMLFYFSESVAAERLFTRSHQIYPVLSGQGSRVILETLGLSWEYTLNGMAVHLNALLSVNNWEMGYLDNFQSIYS